MLDLTVFVPRLKQVIGWTASLARDFDFQRDDYGTVFRQLNPLLNEQPLFTIEPKWGLHNYTTWNVDVYNLNYVDQALAVAFAQRDRLAAETRADCSNFQKLGRILCFEMQMTTHDGAPIAESSGFVDESDVPPIDSWFYLGKAQKYNRLITILFCWIPRQFEPIMQQAIDVEIMGSYHWLDEYGLLSNQELITAMAA